ncbi:hypothetical protein EGJ52_21250 [Pseudomonas luteola]|nr:hypothetical protein EGJ52_21250 [Pseudomonas luteola]
MGFFRALQNAIPTKQNAIPMKQNAIPMIENAIPKMQNAIPMDTERYPDINAERYPDSYRMLSRLKTHKLSEKGEGRARIEGAFR